MQKSFFSDNSAYGLIDFKLCMLKLLFCKTQVADIVWRPCNDSSHVMVPYNKVRSVRSAIPHIYTFSQCEQRLWLQPISYQFLYKLFSCHDLFCFFRGCFLL